MLIYLYIRTSESLGEATETPPFPPPTPQPQLNPFSQGSLPHRMQQQLHPGKN